MRKILFSIAVAFAFSFAAQNSEAQDLVGQDLDIDVAEVPIESSEIIVLDGGPGDFGGVVTGATISFDSTFDYVAPGAAEGGDYELMNLLRNQSIRDEIELVEAQYEKMRIRNEQIQAELKAVSASLLKSSKNGNFSISPEVINKIKERTEELQKRAKVDLEDMLLPHQIKRLKQVALHNRMNQMGAAEALMSGTLAEALELTDEQKELLTQKSKEIEERVRVEIAKIKADAKNDLYKVLDTKQQAKLKELVGDHFEKVTPKRSSIREIMKQRFSKKSGKAAKTGK